MIWSGEGGSVILVRPNFSFSLLVKPKAFALTAHNFVALILHESGQGPVFLVLPLVGRCVTQTATCCSTRVTVDSAE